MARLPGFDRTDSPFDSAQGQAGAAVPRIGVSDSFSQFPTQSVAKASYPSLSFEEGL